MNVHVIYIYSDAIGCRVNIAEHTTIIFMWSHSSSWDQNLVSRKKSAPLLLSKFRSLMSDDPES